MLPQPTLDPFLMRHPFVAVQVAIRGHTTRPSAVQGFLGIRGKLFVHIDVDRTFAPRLMALSIA